MFINIFVDDIRPAPNDECIIARNYESAIFAIKFFADTPHHIILDLDHDLGEGKSGYDICKYVVENEIAIYAYHIHSMNPVGVANMRQLMNHYGYKEI